MQWTLDYLRISSFVWLMVIHQSKDTLFQKTTYYLPNDTTKTDPIAIWTPMILCVF